MGSKHRPRKSGNEPDIFDDYDNYDDEEDYGDVVIDISDLSKDFYSTDWEDPAGSERQVSTRRRIERRNDLKALRSQIDDWGGLDIDSGW